MAGKIVADTLEHSTAGSVDTQYVVNGSAKAWSAFDGSGTVAIDGSNNVSTLTDNGTGDYTIILQNAFGLAPQVLGIVPTSTGVYRFEVVAKDIDRVTVNFFNAAGAAVDADFDICLAGTDMDYTM